MSKYGSQPTIVDGIRFASKREAKRYGELTILERANAIEGLELQPSYKIEIGGILICRYIADFRYFDRRIGERIVEDVKGVKPAVYRLKRKLMRAVHGIEILET